MKNPQFRVLHAFCVAIRLRGSGDQMLFESEAAHELGLDFHTKVYGPRHNLNTSSISVLPFVIYPKKESNPEGVSLLRNLLLRIQFYLWLYNQRRNYDLTLIRYNQNDPLQLIFNIFFRSNKIYVFHSKALHELEAQTSLQSKLKLCIEKIFSPLVIKTSSGVIGVTDEIANYYAQYSNKKNFFKFVYPNGIFLKNFSVTDQRNTTHELLFVASYFFSWQGLEAIIKAFINTDIKIKINVVGTCSSEQKNLVNGDSRFIFHDFKSNDEIKEIASRCTLALAAFGLSVKGLNQSCALKTREYLSLGLPVYAGSPDVFPAQFLYYRVGPADAGSILDYISELGDFKKQDVFEAASVYIDKRILLKDLYAALESHFSVNT